MYIGVKERMDFCTVCLCGSSLLAQLLKNPPATQETPVRFLGWEDPLEMEMATHSSILAGEFHGLVHGVTQSQTQLSDFHFHWDVKWAGFGDSMYVGVMKRMDFCIACLCG